MEALERLLTILAGKQPDRIPFVPLVFGAAAGLTGHSLHDYLHKPEVMVQGQLAARNHLGSDAVYVFGDNALEAEALGCVLDYSRPVYPYVTQPLLSGWQPGCKLPALQPENSGRLPLMLDVCRRLKSHDAKTAVFGHVIGPVTLAAQLMGMDEFIFFVADFPENVPSLLTEASKVVLDYAAALLAAGADGIIIGDPCAAPTFLPAEFYSRWVLPEHRKIMRCLAFNGCLLRWLMVTGNVRRILPHLVQTEANVLTVDYMVDLAETMGEFASVVAGNLKPQLFAQFEQAELVRTSKSIVDLFKHTPRLVLSTGCEIPLETDWPAIPPNLAAYLLRPERNYA